MWDWVIGTYNYEPDKVFSTEGIGISKRPDFPVAYVDQIVEPFRSWEPAAENPTAPATPTV